MQAKDYYKILELPPSATLHEIKLAYRRLAHQYHPDKNNNDLYAAAQFEVIKEAYEVLSDPSKKEYYLQQRWYDQSMNKKARQAVTTPVTVLKQLLELERYVSKLDEYRMDKAGLYAYLCHILANETIEKLNIFNETSVNESIVEAALKCGTHLAYPDTITFSAKLSKINAGPSSNPLISQYIRHARRVYTWNRLQNWIVAVIVILICLLIYILA